MSNELGIKNILFIDTSDNKKITVKLVHDGKELIKQRILSFHKSQVVLELIDELLKEHSLKVTDITEIKVNTGPGSFTGLRVGISVANAFSFALKIPVNGSLKLAEAKY